MTRPSLDLQRSVGAIRRGELTRRVGRITQFQGLLVQAQGPDAVLGEICEIQARPPWPAISAEVVGLRAGQVQLLPHGELHGVALGCEVVASGHGLRIAVGEALLGRVLDATGRAIDGKPQPLLPQLAPLSREPINPLARGRIDRVLETGVRAIDCFLTLGRGQRIGIMSGSGIGKSTLLGMIARDMRADINVIALVGERGREVQEFIDTTLGAEGLARSVVVVATSEQPALLRTRAAWTATAIAEYFRDRGRDVLLVMDSLTRFAMAQREIGLALGEPPTARGYTPSVFAQLPRLLERCGALAGGGSITAICTVLAEGDDLNDPVADAARSLLDGHIVLSRDLASLGHYPAIDLAASISRLASALCSAAETALARKAAALLALHEKSRDLVDIGAYQAGSNPGLDTALRLAPALMQFLQQGRAEACSREEAMRALAALMRDAGAAA